MTWPCALVLVSAFVATGCPTSSGEKGVSRDAGSDRGGVAALASDARPSTGVATTAEQRRLSVKIAALLQLRQELEDIRVELGRDAKTAKSLNAIYIVLRRRLGDKKTDAVVEAVRTARAARERPNEKPTLNGPTSRLSRLRRLEKISPQLMAKERLQKNERLQKEKDATAPPAAGQDATTSKQAKEEAKEEELLSVLRRRLAAEQEATEPMLAAASLGRKALEHVAELKEVVGELAKLAEQETPPSKDSPAN